MEFWAFLDKLSEDNMDIELSLSDPAPESNTESPTKKRTLGQKVAPRRKPKRTSILPISW